MKMFYSALLKLAVTALFCFLHVAPAQAGGPYTDNGETVIEDNTGLEWMKQTADVVNIGSIDSYDKVVWDYAFFGCKNLRIGGYSNWRLPELDELKSLLDASRPNAPYIDQIFQSQAGRYWSNTKPDPDYTGSRYAVDFRFTDGGDIGPYPKNNPSFCSYYARCVRDGNVPFPLSLTFSDRLGRVVSNPPGMDCTDNCTQSFPAGTEVTLTAYDSNETAFSSWINCPNPNGNVCTVTMNQARSIQANYISTLIPETVTVTAPVEGSSFHHGDQVTVQWATDKAEADEYMIIS
ncbi:DUF1566 domain-containing protein, partial [Desulfobulbus sp. TB]|nr:DUF1566 domain-containing protein [Desulfobulbus sp. TB]